MSTAHDEQSIRQEISRLEKELDFLHTRLTDPTLSNSRANSSDPGITNIAPGSSDGPKAGRDDTFDSAHLPSHPLLLLADTALPLGSFAFSSGLESFLAHHPPAQNARPETLYRFLRTSLRSLASATLPYLNATYKAPQRLEELDDILDACTLCPVAKRASKSQGRALISVWERSFRTETAPSAAREALRDFCSALKGQSDARPADEPELNAHFPPIYAVVCAAQGLSLHQTAYTYLFNHAKAITSAAVRASVLGPYAAQALLGSKWLTTEISTNMQLQWESSIEQAGQSIPPLDVWLGRHELLYSRIFNS